MENQKAPAQKTKKFTGKPTRQIERPSAVKTAVEKIVETTTVVDRGGTGAEAWKISKVVTSDMTTRTEKSRKFILSRFVSQEIEGGAGDVEKVEELKEFASLGEARAVVGKTIQHPEKLTVSKADIWAKIKKK